MTNSKPWLFVLAALLIGICWWILSGERDGDVLNEEGASAVKTEEVAELESPEALTAEPNVDLIRHESIIGLETATFEARVFAEGTGQPLEGYSFTLLLSKPDSDRTLVRDFGKTDADGLWSVEVPVGTYDYVQILQLPGRLHVHRQEERLNLKQAELVERVFYAPSKYQFQLTFLASDQQPLAKRKVQVTSSAKINRPARDGFVLKENYHTDDRGTVLVDYLPGELIARLEWSPRGIAVMEFKIELGPEDHGASQTVRLFKTRTVQLVVQDAASTAIEAVQLRSFFPAKAVGDGFLTPLHKPLGRDVLTDSSGRAVLSIALASNGHIQASHPDYQTTFAYLDASQTEVTMQMGLGTGIRGRVVGENSSPVKDATVRLWSAKRFHPRGIVMSRAPSWTGGWTVTTTNDAGEFEFDEITGEGFTSLMVLAKGYAYHGQYWTQPPEGQHEIVLYPEAPLFGIVENEAGAAVVDAQVRVHANPAFGGKPAETLSDYVGTRSCLSDEDGVFTFPGLASGDYEVFVNYEGRSGVAHVHTGLDPVVVVLGEIAPGFSQVEIEVMEYPERWPVADAGVSLHTFGWEGDPNPNIPWNKPQFHGESNADGICETEIIERNNGFLMIYEPGYFPDIIWMNSLPDGFSKRKAYLERTSAQTLHIRAADGKPLRPGTVHDAPDLRHGLIYKDGLYFPGGPVHFSRRLVRFGRYGLADFPDDEITFEEFPPNGATLRLQSGESGPSLDFAIPESKGEFTLTLTMDQLRVLGLR
jgi:protocatechuate 3,4-dioxygenase beta subunit